MLKQWEFMFFFFRVERLLFQMDRFSVTFVSRLEGFDEQPLDYTDRTALALLLPPQIAACLGNHHGREQSSQFYTVSLF